VPLPAGPVVGTCGFAYPEWRGQFYPPELAPSEWLGFYAQVFEAVELDGTFYRSPEPAVVAGWAAALPACYAVSAKVPRTITHEARLQGEAAAAMLRGFAAALAPLDDRLLAVVLQLPPSLHAGEGREPLARLLGGRPPGLPVVVEFRHRSWDRPWLRPLLAELDAELALSDRGTPSGFPGPLALIDRGTPSGFPGPLRADRPGEGPWPAGPARYLRLLGDRVATPAIGRPVRDRSAGLDRWAAILERAGPGRSPAATFANNRYEGAAFTTAAALRRRLGQPAPDPRSLWPAPPLPGLAP
jgi:uncharacterized protein YecE (DUF72 family)